MNPVSTKLHTQAGEAAAAIRHFLGDPPRTAVVLGSGLGSFADGLTDRDAMSYIQIPHFPIPTTPGHSGNLVIGRIDGARLMVLQGRFHYYEGHDLESVTFPTRVFQRLGVRNLILTAAAGGIRPDLSPGDLVAISDHLNMLGSNPLRGRHDERLGTRFPDMSAVYSARLRNLAIEEARGLGFALAEAVYACVPGPSYETPAEIRMLRVLGADVVGMSTVPEALVARHAGMEVLALALVSNQAAGIADHPITHAEVLDAGRAAGERLASLIGRVVARLESPAPPP